MNAHLLAFDSSTEQLSIGVQHGTRSEVRTLAGGAQASVTLIPSAMAMLEQAGLALPQLDALVFGRGPGSFTGLRTACAVAQGLAFGAGIPVLAVDTLLAVAEAARAQAGVDGAPLTVLAVLDARMAEVYSAVYDWDGTRWHSRGELQVGPPERVQRPEGVRVLLAGNAFDAYGERLPEGERCAALPTAAALLRLAPALLAAGQAVPAEQAMPLYIRDKVAQTTAEREAAKAERGAIEGEGQRP
ncbi:MAG: tRNA (adenosine(37)-N6)-threonylcarbamoyltransferase complex dimerization subunit type 1 TsaB [Betaproteobacteria bacterium]|nr:tRNA (adenosine(37)-N6)-threonylcarbamoyltransferase complex dimerization subunit type 1 TsaB [Betaproteobacteria bacterium]